MHAEQQNQKGNCSIPISKNRLAEIETIRDKDLDTSDIPEMDERFFDAAKLVMPPQSGKTAISMRIDEDVLAWFKAQGKGHLSRMNAVLRTYMLTQKQEPEN